MCQESHECGYFSRKLKHLMESQLPGLVLGPLTWPDALCAFAASRLCLGLHSGRARGPQKRQEGRELARPS